MRIVTPPNTTVPDPRVAAPRVFFGAAPVDAIGMEASSTWLAQELVRRHESASWTPIQVMGPNAYLVTLARHNRHFAEALNRAHLCLPDGMSVVWGARLLGQPLPERVPGGEFMERMCALCAQFGLSVYFLGGMPGAAEGAASALRARYPGLTVAGTDCPPPGFERNEEQNEAVRSRIARVQPDLLFVALGAPRQEIWMLDECPSLPIGAALSVGAAFDTQAGLRERAPAWTHSIGAEWLYRLCKEPRRLWKRYLLGNLEFAAITARAWLTGRRAHALHGLLHEKPLHHARTQHSYDEEIEALLHSGEPEAELPATRPAGTPPRSSH